MKKSMKAKSRKGQAYFELAVFLVIIISLNVIANFLFFRIDFTKEKRFTLANSSKQLMRNLEDVVFVKVYLDGEFPAGFKRLRNSTKETLDELRAYAGGNLEYEFINPTADPDVKVRDEILTQLSKEGLNAINLQVKDDKGSRQQIVVPGAIVSYRGRQTAVSLLQSQTVASSAEDVLNNSVQNLEYQLASSIKKITTIKRPKIAFIYGHGELDTFRTRDIIQTLKEYYTVDRVYLPSTVPNELNAYKALIIAKPSKPFLEGEKFNLDQYIMNGGKVLWLVENLQADMDSLNPEGMTLTTTYQLNLDDQLFRYGVRINNDLIQDITCAPIPVVTGNVGSQPQSDLFPWLFYPIFIPTSTHPIVKNLSGIRSEFVNTIDTIDVSGIRKTPLLQSSKDTKVLNAPVRIALQMLSIEPNPEQFNKPNRTTAILLEGKFTSVFKNRLTPKNDSIKFLEESIPTSMIVISDGDIIKNYISKKDSMTYPLGYDYFTRQTFGNKTFIQNCIDYLADDSNLINARSKEVKLRMLDKAKLKAEKLKWQGINLVLPVFCVIIFGIYLHYARKRKYSN